MNNQTILKNTKTINLIKEYINKYDFVETIEYILNNQPLEATIRCDLYDKYENIEDLENILDGIEEKINNNFKQYHFKCLNYVEPIKILSLIEDSEYIDNNLRPLTDIIIEELNNKIEELKNDQ